MLSFSHPNPAVPKPPFLNNHHHHHHRPKPTVPQPTRRSKPKRAATISAAANHRKLPFTPPPPSPPGELYQPFRPPPSSPLPSKYRSLDPSERLAVLRDRLGLWHEFAPLISALHRDGFPPPSIEEATGVSGVEQNRIVVASQVRDSLVSSSLFTPDLLANFDTVGGAELLYELRFLSAAQRAAAAEYAVARRLDPRGAQEVARAMKDFPRRRGDGGWGAFSAASPGDCVAYTHFRLSREAIVDAERVASLERALEEAETEAAKARIAKEMEKGKTDVREEAAEEEETKAAVAIVRLRYGEIAEATTVVLMPVVKEKEGVKGMELAPRRCEADGELGIVEVDKGWARWAVVPGWGPVAEAANEAVAVEVEDGRMLPWRTAMEEEEKVLVVADRRKKEVVEDGVYVVEKDGRLVVEKGRNLVEMGVSEAAGAVVIVVRPPKEEDDQLSDEDWE